MRQIAPFSNTRSIYYNFISMNVSYVTQGLTPQAEAEAEDSTYFRDLLPPGHEIHSFGKQQGKMYLTRCKGECKARFQFNAAPPPLENIRELCACVHWLMDASRPATSYRSLPPDARKTYRLCTMGCKKGKTQKSNAKLLKEADDLIPSIHDIQTALGGGGGGGGGGGASVASRPVALHGFCQKCDSRFNSSMNCKSYQTSNTNVNFFNSIQNCRIHFGHFPCSEVILNHLPTARFSIF